MPRLEEYAPIVGADTLEELSLVADRVKGRSVLHVNSTAVGGGVAEILHRMVPLFRELGLDAHWEVIRGGEDFYAVTKKFHNALHGQPAEFTARDFQVYGETTAENLARLALDAEVVFIHDPQPAALVEKRGANRWVWRCHIDLSQPDERAWAFLRPYVERYDACIVSAPGFAQELPIRQVLIAPSIDPLSEKNRELSPDEVRGVLARLGIPTDKPLVTQVSRFDRLKDPLGVIEAFQRAKPYVDARLLLVGGSADDDPEGAQVLAEVRDRASGEPDILVHELPPTSHLEINAIQRASTVVLQKSLREGFGLTVAEALWKGKPVIAGAVGGIPLLIAHKHSGILVHSVEGAGYWMRRLLSEPEFATRLGANGREHVRQNFLLTRHLRDYLLLILSLDHPGEDFVPLR
ncbi:MAG: glycosyltransferase [Planctomycetes bacterium]|nr:glycosyltransferase [Planctomycetota bacterium]